ncbi:unnamed protein product, partial [Musa hybrid cultivar]
PRWRQCSRTNSPSSRTTLASSTSHSTATVTRSIPYLMSSPSTATYTVTSSPTNKR